MAYARQVLRWEDRLDAVHDARRRPQIATRTIVRAVVVMFLSRRGSLNALEQTKPSSFWRGWLGQAMPSADSIGRICGLMDVADVRALSHQVYSRLKRMKALEPPGHGLMEAVVVGPFADTGSKSFTAHDLAGFRQGADLSITVTKTSRRSDIAGFASGQMTVERSRLVKATPAP